jgi:hypothetical protein
MPTSTPLLVVGPTMGRTITVGNWCFATIFAWSIIVPNIGPTDG